MRSECFKLDDIKRIFRVDCFQKDSDTFEKTHYTLTFVFKSPQGREIVMDESALLEDQWSLKLNERKKVGEYIRPYVIWGATGTGKTELCRWFELHIDHPDYETRRVSKRDLAMGGILGVAQALSGGTIDFGERLLSRQGNVGAEDMAIYVIGNLIDQGKIKIESGTKDQVLEMLKPTIRKNIEDRVRLVESLEDFSKLESTLQFVRKEDLRAFDYYGISFNLAEINRAIYHALTPFIANKDDVKRLIFDYIQQRNSAGKIPVLIFDDVTLLGDLVDEFVSVISDISGGGEGYVCDFVIGTTTEFYLNKFKDPLASTARARVYEIKLSPEEHKEMMHANWLLGEEGLEHFLDFVLRYMNATRSCGGCKECNRNPFIDEGYNYHPFSKIFLINFYRRLLREKDEPSRKGIVVSVTPRFIIQTLRAVLGRFVETPSLPSNLIDNSLLLETVDFFSTELREKEELLDFLRAIWWYGEHSEDDSKVTITLDILRQLRLENSIPSNERGKNVLEFSINPLRIPIAIPPTGVRPKAADDASLLAIIRDWCKGQGGQVAINIIVDGFNQIVRLCTESLQGSNTFRNIMNPKSSREGECIEFVPPGKKECHFWIGEIRGDDDIQIHLLSKYREQIVKSLVEEKGFLVLFLDEHDFFRLYKIGHRSTSDDERVLHTRKFFEQHRDDVFSVLRHQRNRIRKYLEDQLGASTECLALSMYVFASRLFKPDASFGEINNIDEVLELIPKAARDDLGGWPPELKKSLTELLKNFRAVEDLFHSFFSLRGEGSIIDLPILERTIKSLEESGGCLKVLKNLGQIDGRFLLSKSNIKLNVLIGQVKELVAQIEQQTASYDPDSFSAEITALEGFVEQFSDKEKLSKSLQLIAAKLEEQFPYEHQQIVNLARKLTLIERPQDVKTMLDKVKELIASVKDPISKAILTVKLNDIRASKEVEIAQSLNALLSSIEKIVNRALESDLPRLKQEYLKFLKLKEWV